jgi:hypothetical protein
MPFAEPLSVFVSDFGDAGTLDGAAVRGIFDSPGVDQGGVISVEPQFQLPSAQVPTAVLGKALVIPQGSYVVREALPDGTGMTLLLLTAA